MVAAVHGGVTSGGHGSRAIPPEPKGTSLRTRTVRGAAAAAVLAVSASAFAASGSAAQPDGPRLTGVATANTRSDGYAPASKLSPELRQSVVAQGSTLVENPSSLTSTYGYDNDVTNAAGMPQMVPTPT